MTRQEGKKRLFCWYARDGGGIVEVLIVIATLYFFTGVIESHAPVFWKIISD